MSDHVSSEQQRLLDLLSDRALFGLSVEEEQELAKLSASNPDVDANEMDRIVGLLEASAPGSEQPAMPAALKESILQSSGATGAATKTAQPHVESRSPVEKASGQSKNSSMMWLALAATAASLLVAFSSAYWRPDATPTVISIAEQKTQLESTATDLVRVAWTSTDETKPYTGEVTWSNAAQAGFMTFAGLPSNNPTKEQYQLWIFDAEQDERYPIDGGVFDVTVNNTVVAIDPKIKVSKPTMFAITIEKPGGVVVSDRSRLPLIAKL